MRYKVYYGGWYQRTTLHLSEIYGFMHSGHTDLPLNKEKIQKNLESLNLSSVSRMNDYLEYISADTKDGIDIKYYEDGLYVLETESNEIQAAKDKLESYYLENFNPSISYIFSLGAPTPKILANIKQDHPLVVVVESKDHSNYKIESKIFGEVYSVVDSKRFTVFKTTKFIVIAVDPKASEEVSNLVYMQIFFREFKDQLEKYLNIHRKIWEDITLIKDAGSIKGSDISKNRMKLDSYDRSINLINNRINQMGAYVKTRQSISKDLGVEEHLTKVFDYKFETLINTLSYIKEIWAMTKDYVKNVISILSDIENQSLNNSIKSLQIITSVGVVSGILGYLTKTDLPKVTSAGIAYLFLLFASTFLVNTLIVSYYKRIKYKIKISDTSSNL
jgi:hypothetical protein